eukprot:CAMPEP_0171074060 /NCGR_PEP_ID=MMETSP0766_2-20121228/11902_1 /TAXON_ID=439317 /ORGANISM="Gambierdiscus australes, Strain CAWD 149" /LENGTH=176 /DNA_ID=CAMNT_0011530809 /DNA_START=620 /DNA_END=1150 /DNA_ORIENTATION=-
MPRLPPHGVQGPVAVVEAGRDGVERLEERRAERLAVHGGPLARTVLQGQKDERPEVLTCHCLHKFGEQVLLDRSVRETAHVAHDAEAHQRPRRFHHARSSIGPRGNGNSRPYHDSSGVGHDSSGVGMIVSGPILKFAVCQCRKSLRGVTKPEAHEIRKLNVTSDEDESGKPSFKHP